MSSFTSRKILQGNKIRVVNFVELPVKGFLLLWFNCNGETKLRMYYIGGCRKCKSKLQYYFNVYTSLNVV